MALTDGETEAQGVKESLPLSHMQVSGRVGAGFFTRKATHLVGLSVREEGQAGDQSDCCEGQTQKCSFVPGTF